MKQLMIELPNKKYQCLIKEGLFNNLTQYIDFSKETVIITDNNVYNLYLKDFKYQTYIIVTNPGETSKSITVYEDIINQLIMKKYSRDVLIIAIGGGVIGDLAGFIASSYLRGVKYIQIPTTLLAQIDSSIGGKVAINSLNTKNVIGTFYHPDLVLIDPLFLQTLPTRQFNNGVAELIKYALIKDKELFYKLLTTNPIDNISELIYRALMIKKTLVEQDEFDHHHRHLLNFGHTLGHAIEAYYQYKKYLHGEAVAIGIAAMTKNQSFRDEIINILQKFNLPYHDDVDINQLISYIKNDKKKRNSELKIVLLSEIGKSYLKSISIDEIKNYW